MTCAGDIAMTLDIQKFRFRFSQMLTTMRSTGGWSHKAQTTRPKMVHTLPPPPVRMQALPGGSDAAWTVLVYRATDPRSRFEMLME